jgi:hypothetical protein
LGLVILIGLLAWFFGGSPLERDEGSAQVELKNKSGPAATFTPLGGGEAGAASPVSAISSAKEEQEAVPLTEEERHKQIDRKNLTTIHGGLKAFFAKHGRYPDYLSEMVPDFIAAEALESPRGEDDGMNLILKRDHLDPGLEKPAYGYEYSNLEAYGKRTFQEIKDVAKAEWGDVVPVLRAFGYDKVINMSWGGDLYETQLMWEWDPATYDLIDEYGWGPGIEPGGKSVDVVVTDEAGRPVQGAEVWANGRQYTFPLPERPFITDERGIATIPTGDERGASLGLRLEARGRASEPIQLDPGAPPETINITAQRGEAVGGTLLDADGAPVANTHVVITGAADENGSAPLIDYAKTDADGNWTATVLPGESEGVTAAPRFGGFGPPR